MLLSDAQQAAADLSVGSILLVTVDVEMPKGVTKPTKVQEIYRSQLGEALPQDLPLASFRENQLHKSNSAIIDRAIRRGLGGRRNVQFLPMFNFIYKDGHRMLTIGGMIGGPDERMKVDASSLSQRAYYRSSLVGDPFRIEVPTLTRREKLYLDQHMPAPAGWRPADFDLPEGDLRAYAEIYRFIPLYAELLV